MIPLGFDLADDYEGLLFGRRRLALAGNAISRDGSVSALPFSKVDNHAPLATSGHGQFRQDPIRVLADMPRSIAHGLSCPPDSAEVVRKETESVGKNLRKIGTE